MMNVLKKENNSIKKPNVERNGALQARIKCPNCGESHVSDAMLDATYKCQRCNEEFGYDKKLIY